jgi:hypothetical protein
MSLLVGVSGPLVPADEAYQGLSRQHRSTWGQVLQGQKQVGLCLHHGCEKGLVPASRCTKTLLWLLKYTHVGCKRHKLVARTCCNRIEGLLTSCRCTWSA